MPLRFLTACIALLIAVTGAAVFAQTADPVQDAANRLASASAEVRAVERAADVATTREERAALTDRLSAARAAADDVGATLDAQMALVEAKVTEIGPATPGIVDAPDIAQQRRLLAQRRATIDSGIRRGKLLIVEAQQLADQIAADQTAELGRSWATRNRSPLTPHFWTELIVATPRDVVRAVHFTQQMMDDVGGGLAGGRLWLAILGAVVAVALGWPGRIALREAGRRYAIGAAPGHRIRRTGYAMWRLVTGTALPTLAALALVQGLRWSGLTAAAAEPILTAFVFAVGMGGFIGALGAALLMRSQGSWRLLPIGDTVARALLPWAWVLAVLTGLDILLSAVVETMRLSATAIAATDAVLAAVRLLAIGGLLFTLGRLRSRARAAEEEAGAAPDAADPAVTSAGAKRAGVGIVTLVAWLVTLASAAALLIGYTTFSLFLTRIVIEWLAIVVGTFYLLLAFVDDVVTTVFSANSRTGHVLARGVGIRPGAIDQFGVLLSGVLRLGLALVAIVMLLTPFGSGVDSTVERFATVAGGITIGDVSIAPGAILRAVAVLIVGLALARLFLRWLNERYLPTTSLDLSGRNSFALIARYVAVLLATLWGLASLGIGMERIALLLSALSVGIGFGLQAITQNFVSGLILLAERPVKIGDLVRIGTEEGDVKRISVRATEIELADHSTLIVPNSELITKTVLNKTMSNALGRLQIQFSVPLGVEPQRVRTIVLDAFAAEPAILADPAPVAFIDTIADGRILFNCFAHTASPRAAYPTRSAALIAILQRLAEEDIDVGTVPQQLQLLPAEHRPD
ncbi:DUF3772 domain-containing protein [Sphingomonas sp. KR1UV-12]|uniref:DUF3772 domain-containing protein n=1 Tax=Sphingomonas aurea TaxID=3063994 RepID=A0ABT9EJ05_9SPHN|nr:DUF3772 domain-containing protein [Sphingomonas sp. KR1UV-12]MDP1026939.1 DUF3772 domain-containing protein [Sphingomonas sp. KR1UV-12]